MTVPSPRRLHEIGAEIATKYMETDPDMPADVFLALVKDALRTDGYDPTDAELIRAGNAVRALLRQEDKRDEALARTNTLLTEFQAWSERWDAWMDDATPNPDGVTTSAEVVEDFVLISNDLLIPAAEFERVAGMLVSLHEQIEDILELFPDLIPAISDNGRKLMARIYELRRATADSRRDAERAARLTERAAARQPAPVLPARTCAYEGCRKPAKLDNLCKRHARAAGLMPRGKIGEA